MAVEHVGDDELLDGEGLLDAARAQARRPRPWTRRGRRRWTAACVLLAAQRDSARALCGGERFDCPQPRACAFRSKNLRARRRRTRRPTLAVRWARPVLCMTSTRYCKSRDAVRRTDDVQPVAHETRDRIVTGLVTIVPVLALGLVAWQLWAVALGVSDLVVFGADVRCSPGWGSRSASTACFTHRSFKTNRAVRARSRSLGSMAIEGPIVCWVADHRKHHAFSDRVGDPHSPHVDHGHGLQRRAAGARARARRLALHPHAARQQGALRARPDEGPGRRVGRPHVRRVGGRRLPAGVRARLRDRRLAGRPG